MFKWIKKRKKRGKIVVHEVNPAINTTYCQLENGSRNISRHIESEEFPADGRPCKLCEDLKNRKDIA